MLNREPQAGIPGPAPEPAIPPFPPQKQEAPGLEAAMRPRAAIVTLTKSLAGLLAERGIRVNAVALGPVWTPLIPASMPDNDVTWFGTSTPMGRPAQPAELAPVYVLLASDEARFISGGIYEVAGGRSVT